MNIFLQFSDTAKYADIARNIFLGLGYGSHFSFWVANTFDLLKQNVFSAVAIPPVTPVLIAVSFKIFGITDLAVIAVSFFFFLLTLFFVFLLAKKIFSVKDETALGWKSNLIGILSTLAVGLNKDMINYATSGASESPFIFEIVAATYFSSIKKKWANIMTVLLLVLMYFTRPQAFIYIVGIILFWLLNNLKVKKAIIYFIGILVIGALIDYFIILPQYGKGFFYSVLGRGFHSSFNQSVVASDVLRGGLDFAGGGAIQTLKNVFYNIYNYYKLLPEIVSPYLFGLFAISLFIKSKSKETNLFKIATVFMTIVTFLVASVSIPFFRYIHPVVPLIYIIASGTLVELIPNSKFQIPKRLFVVLVSLFLILLFGIGQTLGILLLDSRFERNTHNVGKPPVYVVLSRKLKENTNSNQIVLTNLDTWGSWYGERKTVWFPLEPKQIIDPSTKAIPFDAIYLTSYMMDDENYYMGSDWRLIFENPKDPTKWICEGCSEIAKEYSLKNVYTVNANDNYEKQDLKAILLIKKK